MPNGAILTAFGHLGRDAELKRIGDYDVCEFSMAVSRKRGDEKSTAWYRCQVWGERAAKVAPMLEKGKAVLVVGDLTPRDYTTKQGEPRYSLDVRVNTLEFLGGGASERGEDRSSQPHDRPAPAPAEDDSIPF